MKNKSWKTSACGLAALVLAAWGSVPVAMDDDPLTKVDYTNTGALLGLAIAAMFARDNDKSSEDVGAKKKG